MDFAEEPLRLAKDTLPAFSDSASAFPLPVAFASTVPRASIRLTLLIAAFTVSVARASVSSAPMLIASIWNAVRPAASTVEMVLAVTETFFAL